MGRKKALFAGLLSFLLSLTVVTGLLTIQVIERYGADIFDKNLDVGNIIRFIALAALSVVHLALPISILVLSVFYWRSIAKNKEFVLDTKSTLLPATSLAVLSFIWIAFFTPIINLQEAALLFDIRSKAPDESLKRTDFSYFKGSAITSNFFELDDLIDSSTTTISNKKETLVKTIKANADEEQIRQLLSEESAKKIGLIQESFNIKNDLSYDEGYSVESLKNIQKLLSLDIQNKQTTLNKLRLIKAKMMGFPILVLIVFYLGMALGIINRGNNLVLVLALMFFIVFPIIYYLQVWADNLAKQQIVSPYVAQFYFISILLIITVGLYFYLKQILMRRENGVAYLDT